MLRATQVVATQPSPCGWEWECEGIAEHEVERCRLGGVHPRRFDRGDLADRYKLCELGAGGVWVEGGLDATAVLVCV